MTNTNPEAIRHLVTDVHAAVRRINGVQAGTPLANVQAAFEDHVGPDWRRDLGQTLPAMAHTYQCVEMGWWLLHELEPGTPCTPPSLPDAETREPSDANHAVARVLNAAMNWENAMRAESTRGGGLQAIQARLIAEDALRGEISAYMPLVAK